jgi:hypothetical protein
LSLAKPLLEAQTWLSLSKPLLAPGKPDQINNRSPAG